MLACLSMRDLTHREARVLACVAYHDGPGGAFPSLERIAEEAGMLRGRVVETLATLRRKGRLKSTPGKGKGRGKGREPSRYEVNYGDPEIRAGASDLHLPGKQALQRPGFPGWEQEEHGGESGAGAPAPPPRVAAKPLREREGKQAVKWGCRQGDACGWLLKPEASQCPHCGRL